MHHVLRRSNYIRGRHEAYICYLSFNEAFNKLSNNDNVSHSPSQTNPFSFPFRIYTLDTVTQHRADSKPNVL